MQIKTTMRYHLTLARMAIIKSLQRTNAREGVEKREPSFITGGNLSWNSYYGKLLKIELPYDPAILLLGIHPDKTIIQKDTYTPMFTAVLFTVAKTRKQ